MTPIQQRIAGYSMRHLTNSGEEWVDPYLILVFGGVISNDDSWGYELGEKNQEYASKAYDYFWAKNMVQNLSPKRLPG